MRLTFPPSLHQLPAAIAALLMLVPVAAHSADTRFGLDAELTHDTNVNRAGYANEEQADDILAVEAYAARSFRLSYRSGSVSAGKYFIDRIRFGAGLGLDEREGKEGALYDLSTTRGWLTLDYRVTPEITVYGSTTWIQGDHVFTANNPATQAKLIPYANVIVADPAFADAFAGAPVAAYRMEATTLLFEAGVNIPITGGQALDFGASWFDSEADRGGGEYDGATFRIGYLYRFH